MIPDTQRNSGLSIDWIYKAINVIITTKQTEEASVLLILDDVVSDMKDHEKDPRLISLFFNRRHLLWNGNVSIMITTQKYTMIPARFRSCITDIIIFNLSPFDTKKVFEESILKYTKREWEQAVSKIFDVKFSNMHVDIDTQEINLNCIT